MRNNTCNGDADRWKHRRCCHNKSTCNSCLGPANRGCLFCPKGCDNGQQGFSAIVGGCRKDPQEEVSLSAIDRTAAGELVLEYHQGSLISGDAIFSTDNR